MSTSTKSSFIAQASPIHSQDDMCNFSFQLFLLSLAIIGRCEWVEIPQFSSKKSYIGVTPFAPYIYDKSTVFTSTTTSAPYETIATPIFNPIKNDGVFKKSITKLPDSVMKNFLLTTPISTTKRTTLHPFKRNATNKPNKKLKNPPKLFHPKSQRKGNATRTTTTTEKSTYKPKVNQVLLDEHEYEEAIYDDDEEYEDERGLPVDDESAEMNGDYEYYEDDAEYDGESVEDDVETQKGTSEGFTYAGFLPYLQSIQSTLIRNSHKSAHEKVSFLTEIKNRLLYAIQQKIASLWSSGASKSRKARSTRGDYQASWEKGDGGMGFPSNEGALLTLGFLTFAVFLIKCVLKLVQAMKDKGGHGGYHQNVVVVVATTAAPVMMGKRSISDKEIAEMMNNIDSYKYK